MPDNRVPKDFNPGFSHPYYFTRKGLFKALCQLAGELEGKLMDFGCGRKPYKSLFKVESYIGVDFYNEGHPHDNEQIDVFYDGKNIPFEPDTFDSILCSEVFEHLFNLPELLPQLYTVLKPGGKMLITCPFIWPLHEKPYDFARYTPFALRQMLEKCGFDILIEERSGNFFLAICQLRVAYLHDIVFSKLKFKPFVYIAYKIVIPVINYTGAFFNKLFPVNQDVYLNNITVVQKSK
jgi:SAM-dependent methyltransferase